MKPTCRWCTGAYKMRCIAEQAMDDLLQNFPNRVVAGLLNVVIFPTGRHYLAPSDKLDHKVAKILQVPNATRSRIVAVST